VNNFSGDVLINAGKFVCGHAKALGDPGFLTTTTVADGATLDENGKNLTYEHIYIAGAGVDGTGAIINNTAAQTSALRRLTLTGDATVGGSYRMDVKGSSTGAETITGNGHDLTIKMTAAITSTNSYFSINDMAVDNLGNINIESGTLNVVRSPLGDPTKTVTISADGQLKIHQIGPDYAGPSSITKPIVSNGGIISVFDAGGKNFWGGTVTLNADTTVDIDSGESLTMFDPVIGTGGIVKNGTGNFLLTDDCTYSGTTTLNGGIFAFGHSDYQTGSPGTGDFVIEGSGKLYFNTNQAFTLSGDISGTATGTGIKYGSGTAVPNLEVTLTGNNTYDSNTYVYFGNVIAGSDTALGSTVGFTNIDGGSDVTNDGRVSLPGGRTIAESFVLAGRGGDAAANPHIVNQSGSNTLSGAISFAGGGNMYNLKSDAGLLTVAGDVTSDLSTDRYLQLQGEGDGVVSGSILLGTGETMHVVKTGAGTWTLESAGNTYNGMTTVSGGTLALGASASIASSAGIDVQIDSFFDVSAAGFTLGGTNPQTLKGNGTVVGDVVAAGNGSIEPGESVGTLTVDGNVTAAGTLKFEFNGDDDTVDKLVVTGDLDLGGATIFWENLGVDDLAVGTYEIATFGGTLIEPADWNTPSGMNVEVTETGSGYISLVVIPEPSTVTLLWLAGLGLFMCMKRLR
jgi:fibronectin-binding autotransporter adhesin